MKNSNQKIKTAGVRAKNPCGDVEDAIFVHRLKHGLTSIKWSLRMILSEDFGKLSGEQKDIVEKDLEETDKLIILANSMLDEQSDTKSFLDKNLCYPEDIVESVIKYYSTKILDKKIELKYAKPDKKIEAFLDKEKIKICIQNILDNAIKYTHEGGKIIISLIKNKNNLQIKMHDSGIGIEESHKRKLFTKFFRGTNAVEINKDGSGLGLFIAKNIITEHGGNIWFESKAGEGSTFYIELPIKYKK